MMTLYFTRHGETEWNYAKRIQGQMNSPLTGTGILQARALKRTFESVRLSGIYTSPLGRALQTANLLAEETGLCPQTDDRLKEWHLGQLQGLTLDEAARQFPEQNDVFRHRPYALCPTGGESFQQVRARVIDFLHDMATKEGAYLVVAHALILRALRMVILDLPIEQFTHLSTPGCCLCEAQYSDHHWTLIRFGERLADAPVNPSIFTV